MESNFKKYNVLYTESDNDTKGKMGVIYLPKSLELYHIEAWDPSKGSDISSFIGILPYSKNLWDYAQTENKEVFDITTGEFKQTDYPVFNMPNFKAYNLYYKYIVYVIKDFMIIDEGNSIKTIKTSPTYPYDIMFFSLGEIDDNISRKMAEILCDINIEKDKRKSIIKELAKDIEKRTKFIQVHNFIETEEKEIAADCTIVSLSGDNTGIYDQIIPLDRLNEDYYSIGDKFLYLSNKEEYIAAFMELLNKKVKQKNFDF